MTLSARSFLARIVLLNLAVVFLLNFAQAQSSASPNPQFAKLLAEPLPGHPKAQSGPSLYKPDTLYQYIDGGADVYLLYDFQILLHQDFKSGAAELTADVYDMGSPKMRLESTPPSVLPSTRTFRSGRKPTATKAC